MAVWQTGRKNQVVDLMSGIGDADGGPPSVAALGEDTDQVLAEILGLGHDELARLLGAAFSGCGAPMTEYGPAISLKPPMYRNTRSL